MWGSGRVAGLPPLRVAESVATPNAAAPAAAPAGGVPAACRLLSAAFAAFRSPPAPAGVGPAARGAAEASCYDSGMRRHVLLWVALVAAAGLPGACTDSLNPFSPGNDTDTQPTFPNPIPNQTWTVGVVVNLTLPAATGGDAPLTYSLTPALPAGLAFNAATRAITGTPSAAQSSTSYIYTVTDNDSDSASMQFQASVAAAG